MKQGLPESARDALARQTTAEEHPSADLLSAFAEQALSPAEKKQVTTHLSACAECREAVFLASSAAPQEQLVLEPIAVPGWRRWMSWKWIVPLATAIVIAVAVIPRPENPLRPLSNKNVVALNQPSTLSQLPPASTTASNDTKQLDSRQTTATSFQTKPSAVPKVAETQPPGTKLRADADRQLAQAQGNAALSSSLVMPQAARSINEPAASSAHPVSQPAQSAAAKDSLGKSVSGGAIAPAMKAEKSAAASQPAEVISAAPLVTTDSTAAAPPPLANATSRPGQSGTLYAAKGKAATPLAHWRITSDGQLQRSFDSSEWTRVLPDQPVAFRAVAVVGGQVWAGGSGGALFQSTDDGAAWTKVELTADGQAERGAIVSMHFDSVLRGSVTTDSGSTWLTTDGGKIWTKQ